MLCKVAYKTTTIIYNNKYSLLQYLKYFVAIFRL